jgi:hypothetical protein
MEKSEVRLTKRDFNRSFLFEILFPRFNLPKQVWCSE